MEPLLIPATKSSPFIHFNPALCIFEIKGHSFPENAIQFYKPVIDWLSAFFSEGSGAVTFSFYIIYLNTSSSKFLFALFDLIENQFLQGKAILVNWYYDTDNELALECGEFFMEERSFPFMLIENNENILTL